MVNVKGQGQGRGGERGACGYVKKKIERMGPRDSNLEKAYSQTNQLLTSDSMFAFVCILFLCISSSTDKFFLVKVLTKGKIDKKKYLEI